MDDTAGYEPTGQAPAGRLIEWTGERCVPWTDDLQVVYEHYHRYALAARYVTGARVLDLACGEGYGPALLADVAREVVGVDLDPRTVEHAATHYPRPNLRFLVGSMTDPGLLANSAPFDVITCFEALEHVAEQDALLAVVRRLLAPGGLLLTSTPDVAVYTHQHGNDNPFHVRELTEDEFRSLLGGSFAHVAVLRQNVVAGSLITTGPATPAAPEPGDQGRPPGVARSLRRSADSGWLVGDDLPHTYLLALASDAPLPPLPELDVLVDPELTLVREAQRALARDRERAEAAQAELHRELRAEQQRATEDRQAAACRLKLLDEELDHARAEIAELHRRAELAESRATWQEEIAAAAEQRSAELEAEVLQLRAEQSATAHRLIARYRSTVERAAPRGTVRRDLYERAMGRGSGSPTSASAPPGPVRVSTSSNPLVSVVIPVHGKWEFTHRCLTSIQRHRPTVPFEVIVVDDASPDRTAELVAASPGVRLVRAERNLGFVGACNLGAGQARGSYLMFLNNDTEVREGWLDALVGTAEEDERIGLVGARLVYPDGRLQECGGIVWADGTGWNYGRGQRADAPEYLVRRDVDYCSGAAILVRRTLFVQLGGFDQRYAPAYYEDTDLAFAVRAAGYRTVVEPAAVVVHHEGVSHGTDLSAGIKRHQEINRVQFVEKWAGTLAGHLPAASPANLWLARQRGRCGHRGGVVLVADHQVPTPDRDSGSMRMHRLLGELVALGQRVVFFPANGAPLQPYTADLQRRGVTVLTGEAEQRAFLDEAGPVLRLALLSRPQVAWRYLEELRMAAPQCLIGYDTVDLHFVRLQRQAELAAAIGEEQDAQRLTGKAVASRELELGLVRASDLTVVVSEPEQRLLRELVPEADVRVVSNVHRPHGPVPGPRGRSGLLFVGSFDHVPNRDAARWMAHEVLPLVRRSRPETVLHVVGSNPSDDVLALAGDAVQVHGWVPDLTALYRSCRVAVAPLRFGAGVKGKVGESLAAGLPMVGTPVALEGMRLRHGEHVLVADDAAGFAEQVVALLGDDELWRRLSGSGAVAVADQFGPQAARAALKDILDTAAKQLATLG